MKLKLLLEKIISDIFQISLITYLVYFVLELIKTGLISNYFDLNLLLIWTLAWGALSVIISRLSH